jgi:hypothetical protein
VQLQSIRVGVFAILRGLDEVFSEAVGAHVRCPLSSVEHIDSMSVVCRRHLWNSLWDTSAGNGVPEHTKDGQRILETREMSRFFYQCHIRTAELLFSM